MAQHDYNLANQSGADFRADLNNALSAIVTVNSGATAPSTTFAHQLWVDTSSSVLKIRNSANDAWVTTGVSITADNTFAGNLTGNVTGNVTGDVTGNADTATALETARTINGASFDGTANISFGTDSVSEGSSNLYYTNARVESYLDAGTSTPTFASAVINTSLTGSAILDDDTFGTASVTTVATSESIKAYVDSQIGSVDTLAEILLNGNTTGGTDIAFGDNDKAIFGTGSDLEIYHDGSNSWIKDAGTGDLVVRSSTNIFLQDATGANNYAKFTTNAVELRHNNDVRFTTTSSGVNIVGTVTSDGLTVDGNAKLSNTDGTTLRLEGSGASSGNLLGRIKAETSLALNGDNPASIKFVSAGTLSGYHGGRIQLYTTNKNSTGELLRLNVAETGDISFYDDTGTSQALFWDASAESLRVPTLTISDGGITTTAAAGDHTVFNSTGADADFRVRTGANTHSLYVQGNTGNVGIGTDSPDAALEVNSGGGIHLTDNTVGRTLIIKPSLTGSVHEFTSDNTAAGYAFSNSSSELMRLTPTGLGIGTSSPQAKLHIDSTGDALQFTRTGQETYKVTHGTSGLYTLLGSTIAIGVTQNHDFGVYDNTGSQYAMFDGSTSRVGIGTTSPSAKLSIHAAVNNPTIEIVPTTDENSADTAVLRLWGTRFGTANRYSEIRNVTDGSTANNELAFNTNGSEALRIDSSQRVGIGTSSPNLPLTILGDDSDPASSGATATGALQIQQPTNNVVLEAGVKANSSRYAWLQATHKADHSSVYNMALNPNGGNVGIGTDSPSAALDVGGQHLLQDNYDATGAVFRRNGTYGSVISLGRQGVGDGATLDYPADNTLAFSLNGSERARFDSSGNFLVGKTSTAVSATGIQLQPNGNSAFIREGGTVLYLNRKTNDGIITAFRKDNTAVGYIGTASGTLVVGTTNGSGSYLKFGSNVVAPVDVNGAVRDNAIDLGQTNARFKDLHLSGTANVGTSVGIGTTSPSEKLHVVGGAATVKIESSTNEASLKYDNSTTTGAIKLANNDLKTELGGSEVMRILANGNVGIGTTNPTSTLTVDGTINGIGIKAGETDFIDSILISGNGATGTLSSATSNTGLGSQVLANLTSGASNVAVGRSALNSLTTGGSNVAVGRSALLNNTTANNCTAMGFSSLGSNISGSNNVAVGSQALSDVTTESGNTAVGSASLANNTASENTAIGKDAGRSNTTGNKLVAVGFEALELNTTGSANTAIGYEALLNNTTASNNTAIGRQSLRSNTTGSSNTAIGDEALENNTTGFANTAVGSYALRFNTTSSANVAFGYQALYNSTGQSNVAVGYTALFANTSGSDNTAVGRNALVANTTGAYNVAVGKQALDANTSGANNTAVGYQAAKSVTTGQRITAIGYGAGDAYTDESSATAIGWNCLGNATVRGTGTGAYCLSSLTTGGSNAAFGYYAMNATTTGANNSAFGDSAMQSNTTGSSNVAVGRQALKSNTTASNNTAIGFESLFNNETGTGNTAVGYRSLRGAGSATANYNTGLGHFTLYALSTGTGNVALGHNAGNDITTSSYNTLVGQSAGEKITTGGNNTAVGRNAGDSITTGSNNTCIGYQADAASATATNSITLGNGGITSLRCNTC